MAEDVSFFAKPTPVSIADIAALSGTTPAPGADLGRMISGATTPDLAGPADICFADKPRFVSAASTTRAGAIICRAADAGRFPAATAVLLARDPQRAFALVLARLYPESMKPRAISGETGVSRLAVVASGARIEAGAIVEPGAIVGDGAAIGTGTVIGPHAVIGANVRIGRNCLVGAGSTVQFALIGDRVLIHPGVRIGQDGFGYIGGAAGHAKVPQIGRVIIQDDVEIGANSCIDRGASRDTVIGEGTKIDNLVQIGHNCVIGRHCVICAQTGLAGSSTLEDFVVLGGQVGLAGHLVIGAGAQIAAQSGVAGDVPRGARYGGYPAQPALSWARETAMLKSLLARRGRKGDTPEG